MRDGRRRVLAARGHSRPERLEGERVDVHPAAYGGVGRVEQLEAVVDEEAVDSVGADAAADAVRGLEDHDVSTRVCQRLGAPQAGQAGTHDHHVGSHAARLGEAATQTDESSHFLVEHHCEYCPQRLEWTHAEEVQGPRVIVQPEPWLDAASCEGE